MRKQLIVGDTSTVDGLAVYWIEDENGQRQFGVCFENGYFNIANQGIAESVTLAMSMANNLIDDMKVAMQPSANAMKCAVCEYLLQVNRDMEGSFIPPTAIDWLGNGIVSAILQGIDK